ncbi:glycosyltransferase family 2 protein [Flectobacillus sp. BAB-3569]|uniref:glycosyltransferase n=1 Tax=Flectobacillus sp. BAB-3569 TaxID=1509483 RepID=UPI000BA34D7B|nr:glycosyltransferase [Flectobacillus sp. BAB-3569]PAC31104.1 glycosyltransferase [Flectobacillus sp. BAB-3569]
MRNYSIIIPVYNRPDELDELLACLTKQTYKIFEVVVVEDGSAIKADKIVEKYHSELEIKYIQQQNTGQGFARNTGFKHATGDYFIILDSDALIEPNYLEIVEKQLNSNFLDLYGGPDRDHPNFTPIQKAISYSMTSLFTTGGIRGSKKNLGGTFHPRSFNMGMSKEVYRKTQGFIITRMGEDIEFSIRAISLGFKSGLIPEAFIYHKRRTSFIQFYKQLRFFGKARINISRFFPKELKLVHTFPMVFTLGLFSIPLWWLVFKPFFYLAIGIFALYTLLNFIDSTLKNKSIQVGLLSIIAIYVQLVGYGVGFITEGWKKLFEEKGYKQLGDNIEYPS